MVIFKNFYVVNCYHFILCPELYYVVSTIDKAAYYQQCGYVWRCSKNSPVLSCLMLIGSQSNSEPNTVYYVNYTGFFILVKRP